MARRNDGDRTSLPRQAPHPSQSAASASHAAAARPIIASSGLQSATVDEPPHKKRNSKFKNLKKHPDAPSHSTSSQMRVTYDAMESDIQIVRSSKKESRVDMTFSAAKASSQNAHAWKRKKRRSSKELFSAPIGKVKYIGEETACTQSLISGFISIILTLFLSVPISLLVLLTLPMAVIVKTLGTACFHPRLPSCGSHEYLSAHDAHFFSQSTQSILHSILIVDGLLPLARVRQVVSARVIEAKNGSGELLFPRFTSRVRKHPFGPAWEPDRSFHVHHHIYLGPRLNSKEELQNYVSDVLSKPLSPDRPLWEVIVVGGGEQDGVRDTVLVCRIHPCIGDGISLMRVLCQALSDNHVQHLPPKPHFGATTYATSIMQAFFSAPLMIIKWLWWWPREHNLLTDSHYFAKRCSAHSNQLSNSVPHSLPPNDQKFDASNTSPPVQNHHQPSDASKPRSCVANHDSYVVRWSAGVSLAKVTRVKLVTRTCLNDVLLAALAGALRRVMQKRGLSNPPDLMANVAVDLRSRPLSFSRVRLGVRASYAPVTLPLECDAAVPRLWKLKAFTEKLKSGCDSVVWWVVTWWCQRALPTRWGHRFVGALASRGSLLYASLPGPHNALQIAGYSVQHMYSAVPPSDWPLSVSVVTYADHVHVTCTVRRDVYRCKALATCILKYTERQLEQLFNMLSTRRLPGDTRRPLLAGPSDATLQQPVAELQAKLSAVQHELQAVTVEFELFSAAQEGGRSPPGGEAPGEDLAARVQLLKEEFTVLLSEIRRRRSVGDAALPLAAGPDDDGELRKFRRRALSTASIKTSVASWETSCTARPLTAPTLPIPPKDRSTTSLLPSTAQRFSTGADAPSSTTSESSIAAASSGAYNEQQLSNNVTSLPKTSPTPAYSGGENCDTKNPPQVLENYSISRPSTAPVVSGILKTPVLDRESGDRISAFGQSSTRGWSVNSATGAVTGTQNVTWKDQAVSDNSSSLKAQYNSPELRINNRAIHAESTNSDARYSANSSLLEKSWKENEFQRTASTSRSHSTGKRSSQPDLSRHPISQIQRPNSQGNLFQQVNLASASCILHPIACVPASSGCSGSTSVISKSMQRPASVPPRTIHPSLRSHFAIEKSHGIQPTSAGVRPVAPSQKFSAQQYQHKQQYQPIATPLIGKRDVSKQSYQRLNDPTTLPSSIKKIETDIM